VRRRCPFIDLGSSHECLSSAGHICWLLLLWVYCRINFSQNFMAQPQGKRILFVDDEDSIRLTLPLVLQQRGFEVKVAGSVAEAVAKIKSNTFDVLLSDLNIGEAGDGFAVVRAIREVNAQCVAIILTGYPGFESAVEGIHHDIDDYVVKPADIDVLVATVEQRLAARGSK
jgi:DNA-binding NtrC family response regulator